MCCACTAAAVVQSRVQEAELTELEINKARDQYRHPPAEAARLWFVVAALVALHPMYTVSLESFKRMFRHCISVAPATATLEDRMFGLVKHLHGYVYSIVSRGLLHAHKLAFAFSMATSRLRETGSISEQEWQLFVKAGVAPVQPPSSSSSAATTAATKDVGAPTWCKHSMWTALQALESALAPQLQGLCQAVSSSSSSSNANPGAAAPAGWQQLLLHGTIGDFIPVVSVGNGGRGRSDSSGCLLDTLLAAGAIGGQQQQTDINKTVSADAGSLSLFQRVLLIKVTSVAAIWVVNMYTCMCARVLQPSLHSGSSLASLTC
jgi:hypothetical protein